MFEQPRSVAWAALLVLSIAACAAKVPPPEDAGTPRAVAPFALGPGDVISVLVFKHPEFSRDVTVRPDGKISYPMIGDLQASGLTVEQMQATLARELAGHVKKPQVTVVLSEVHSLRIFVLGEVSNPGSFHLRGPVTVVQAIAMAGGFTPFASTDDIVVYNAFAEGPRLPFDYDAFVDGDDLAQNVSLRPGDTVLVR